MKNGTKNSKKENEIKKMIQEADEELDAGYYRMDWRASRFMIHPSGGYVDLIFEDDYGVKVGITLTRSDCKILKNRLKKMSKMLLD